MTFRPRLVQSSGPDQGDYHRARARAREKKAAAVKVEREPATCAVFVVRQTGNAWMAETPPTWGEKDYHAVANGSTICEALFKLAMEIEARRINEAEALAMSGSVKVPEDFMP